ncbi:MAG: FAD:protein FMN transferase, partial [Rubrimonas sp.]
RAALAAALAALAEAEALFSLHRADSALARLNAAGALAAAPAPFLDLVREARAVSAATGGFFDATVQPLWAASAQGGDAEAARRLVGWRDLRAEGGGARFARPGMAASFNGIAQGWAADRVAAALRAHGFADALIDMGEFMGAGRRGAAPWRIGVAHPAGGIAAEIDLRDRALATSAPRATLVGPQGAAHVFDPVGAPGARWAQISVVAATAARADALATALAAAPMGEARRLLRAGGGDEAVAIAEDGAVLRLRG